LLPKNNGKSESSLSGIALSSNIAPPQCNKINFYSVLSDKEHFTTIMIRNIPMRFTQLDMLRLIDKHHAPFYDYFYLPIDLKTLCNRGYAYINFTHPIFLLDFYLEFQGLRWNQHFRNCNSQKTCVLHYANI